MSGHGRVLCADCGASLENDEVALCYRNHAAFRCLDCMASRLDCKRTQLSDLIEYYKSGGCEYFTHEYVEVSK